jgi:hypothetical protein
MAGIGLTDFLYPLGSFYILEDIYLKGGYRAVLDNTARDAIATSFRKDGMLVYNQTTGDFYKLGPGLMNADWVLWAPLPPANSVTNTMLSNMADSTIKGRAVGAGVGSPQDLTGTQATAILVDFVGDSGLGGTKGLVPAPAAGDAAANRFLKADGTWTTPAGGGGVNAYRTSFTDANLVGGVLTVNHNLGVRYNLIAVYDNVEDLIYPDEILDVDTNNVDIDLTSFQTAGGGSIPGTWNVVVVG